MGREEPGPKPALISPPPPHKHTCCGFLSAVPITSTKESQQGSKVPFVGLVPSLCLNTARVG